MTRNLSLFGSTKIGGLTLREPQVEMVMAYNRLMTDAGSTGLMIAPTGIGKTEVAFACMAKHATSMLVSPYVDTTKQTYQRLSKHGLDVGLEWRQLKSDAPHTVTCYDSLMSRDRYQRFVGNVELVIVDEVHLNYSKQSLQMLSQFRESGARILGMTATPERSGDPITEFYERVLYEYRIPQATEDGWLVPAKVWLSVLESLDLSDWLQAYGGHGDIVPPKHGDPLHTLMARDETVQAVSSLIYQHHEGQPFITFAAGIRQAQRIVECLHDRGLEVSIVHSRMDKADRDKHLSDFEAGVTAGVINVGCLIVGYDFPPMRKLFLARPTASRSRFTQMVGRMTRPLKGVVDGWSSAAERRQAIANSDKPFFEVFDFTDTSRRCDLLSALDLFLDGVDPTVARRAKRRAEGKSLTKEEVDIIAQEEAREVARERRLKEDMELARVGGVMSGQFGIYGRDQFAAAEGHSKPKYRGWHILWGKLKGWPLPDAVTKDPSWVKWHLTKLSSRQESYAAAILRELRKQGKAT